MDPLNLIKLCGIFNTSGCNSNKPIFFSNFTGVFIPETNRSLY